MSSWCSPCGNINSSSLSLLNCSPNWTTTLIFPLIGKSKGSPVKSQGTLTVPLCLKASSMKVLFFSRTTLTLISELSYSSKSKSSKNVLLIWYSNWCFPNYKKKKGIKNSFNCFISTTIWPSDSGAQRYKIIVQSKVLTVFF